MVGRSESYNGVSLVVGALMASSKVSGVFGCGRMKLFGGCTSEGLLGYHESKVYLAILLTPCILLVVTALYHKLTIILS